MHAPVRPLPPRWLPLLLAVILLAPACTGTDADAQAPAWRSFSEAVTAAQQSGKRVLIDVYAPWCGWCRKMQAEVYTDPDLLAYLNEHFELGRLNLDEDADTIAFKGFKLSSAELAAAFGATATPTTVFLEPDGSYITRLPGYVPTEDFMQVLRFIATGAYREQTFDAFRRQGS